MCPSRQELHTHLLSLPWNMLQRGGAFVRDTLTLPPHVRATEPWPALRELTLQQATCTSSGRGSPHVVCGGPRPEKVQRRPGCPPLAGLEELALGPHLGDCGTLVSLSGLPTRLVPRQEGVKWPAGMRGSGKRRRLGRGKHSKCSVFCSKYGLGRQLFWEQTVMIRVLRFK